MDLNLRGRKHQKECHRSGLTTTEHDDGERDEPDDQQPRGGNRDLEGLGKNQEAVKIVQRSASWNISDKGLPWGMHGRRRHGTHFLRREGSRGMTCEARDAYHLGKHEFSWPCTIGRGSRISGRGRVEGKQASFAINGSFGRSNCHRQLYSS